MQSLISWDQLKNYPFQDSIHPKKRTSNIKYVFKK